LHWETQRQRHLHWERVKRSHCLMVTGWHWAMPMPRRLRKRSDLHSHWRWLKRLVIMTQMGMPTPMRTHWPMATD